jgi:hypothetical protein
MTIVIAHQFLNSVMIFADCRVSYKKTRQVDDNLLKIYQIDSRMVIGFSGSIEGAHRIMNRIKKNVADYSKPPVAVNLLRDVKRWIRYEYRELPSKQKKLSFILTAVEPTRTANSQKPDWIPSRPELWIVKLCRTKEKPGELVELKESPAIIGIDEATGRRKMIVESIRVSANNLFGFSFKQPNLQAVVMADTLMTKIMESDVKSIGGLFQGAILDRYGIRWLTYGSSKIGLKIVNCEYIQYNNITDQEVRLRTIWEWWQEWNQKSIPGESGVFEDADLRMAIDNQRQTE